MRLRLPITALLWASYLFPEQIHWATLQYRGFTEEYWTLPKVPGPRFNGPVVVLTNARTSPLQARRQVTEHFSLLLPEAKPLDVPYRKPPSDPPAKPAYTAGSSTN